MSIAVCVIVGPLLSHLIQHSRSISSLRRSRWRVVSNLTSQIVRWAFWYFASIISLHVPQVTVNSYVSLILALASAIIEGLILHFFLLLFTSLFFICPFYILLLRFIHTLFIFVVFLVILNVFGIFFSLWIFWLPFINFAILRVFGLWRRSFWQITVFDLHLPTSD
jgi:hypothetical protein